MFALSSGSMSRTGVAMDAIWPPGRSAASATMACGPPTKSAMASTGPPASATACPATSPAE